MSSLGQICIVGAFALALYAIVSSLVGVHRRSPDMVASGQNAAWAVAALITMAWLTLLSALAVHNFSLLYCCEHSNRALPRDLFLWAFKIGHQGSILLV